MKSSKFWIAVVVAGVAANALDFVIQTYVFGSMYTSNSTLFNNNPANIPWYVVGDFVAVLVMSFFYDKVYASFEGGPTGGMKFGAWYGLVVSFPGFIFLHLMINGYSYKLAWMSIIYSIIWGAIIGTVVGAMYKKGAATAA